MSYPNFMLGQCILGAVLCIAKIKLGKSLVSVVRHPQPINPKSPKRA